MGRQHCSSLCSQSEGHGHVAKMLKFAIGSLFYGVSAIKSSPSLCEQSELQCFASDFRLFQTRVQFSLYFTPLKKVFRISFPARILQLILNTYLFAEERFRSFLFLKDPLHFSVTIRNPPSCMFPNMWRTLCPKSHVQFE